jgi:hypothetical protein
MRFKLGTLSKQDLVDGVRTDAGNWIAWEDRAQDRQGGFKTLAGIRHTVFIDSIPVEVGGPPQICGIRVLGTNDGLSIEQAEAFREHYLGAVGQILGRPGEPIRNVDPEFPGVERHYRVWPHEQSFCVAGVGFSFEDCRARAGYVEYVTCSIELSRAVGDPAAETERREKLLRERRGNYA